MRASGLALAVVLSAGCAAPPDRVDHLAQVDCGAGLTLRFEETRHVANRLAGVTAHEAALLVSEGTGWRVVDRSDHYEGPEAYSRLLSADLGARVFPLGERGPREEHAPWGVFADPAVLDPARYTRLAACLEQHLPEIDRAFDQPREPGEPLYGSERRRRLSSIVRARYDAGFELCGPRDLGPRWTCADGKGYVKMVPEAHFPVRLCSLEPEPPPRLPFFLRTESFPHGMALASLSGDQSSLTLAEPQETSHEYKTLLAGRDTRAYYADCRDSAGRGLFEVLPEAAPPAAR